MSAKSLMANEGLLQEIESRIAEIRKIQAKLVARRDDPKLSFAEGIDWVRDYDVGVEIVQECSKQLFAALDLQDPEDNEFERREAEDEEEEEDEDDEDDEAEDAEDDE